jgi:hypothetical protein
MAGDKAAAAAAAPGVSSAKAAAIAGLRRSSMPAMHIGEDNSAAIMLNPPVFNNPLRRRGCCDHRLTQEVRRAVRRGPFVAHMPLWRACTPVVAQRPPNTHCVRLLLLCVVRDVCR